MELSKQSRLHYHGWITFSSDEDIRYFYLIMIRKLKNKFTYDIHPISDYKEGKNLVINILLGRLM